MDNKSSHPKDKKEPTKAKQGQAERRSESVQAEERARARIPRS